MWDWGVVSGVFLNLLSLRSALHCSVKHISYLSTLISCLCWWLLLCVCLTPGDVVRLAWCHTERINFNSIIPMRFIHVTVRSASGHNIERLTVYLTLKNIYTIEHRRTLKFLLHTVSCDLVGLTHGLAVCSRWWICCTAIFHFPDGAVLLHQVSLCSALLLTLLHFT